MKYLITTILLQGLITIGSSQVVIHEQLSYSNQDPHQKLNLYLPEKPDRAVPCIMVIQGGGFMARNGKGFREFAVHFAKNGFAAASIGYRGRPDHTCITTLADARAAVRYLREVSGSYGIDPNRIGAMGRSAGGTIAILLATVNGEGDSIQAAVGIAGVYDFVARFTDPAQMDLQPKLKTKIQTNGEWVGPTFSPTNESWLNASAVNHVDAEDPPVLLLHSKNDATVPWLQSSELHKAIVKAGGKSELKITENGGHKGPRDSMDLMVQFFQKTLNSK